MIKWSMVLRWFFGNWDRKKLNKNYQRYLYRVVFNFVCVFSFFINCDYCLSFKLYVCCHWMFFFFWVKIAQMWRNNIKYAFMKMKEQNIRKESDLKNAKCIQCQQNEFWKNLWQKTKNDKTRIWKEVDILISLQTVLNFDHIHNPLFFYISDSKIIWHCLLHKMYCLFWQIVFCHNHVTFWTCLD